MPTCAPIAAGRPKPIVPSEPDETIERGSDQRMNCRAEGRGEVKGRAHPTWGLRWGEGGSARRIGRSGATRESNVWGGQVRYHISHGLRSRPPPHAVCPWFRRLACQGDACIRPRRRLVAGKDVRVHTWHDIIWWLPTPVETTSFSRCGLKPSFRAAITCGVGVGVCESSARRWTSPSRGRQTEGEGAGRQHVQHS